MAGTSKIHRFFVTTTAGEDETPRTIQEIEVAAIDVAPPLPAPEDESAAETTAAESAPGPLVQEFLTLDNPTDRALFQLGTWPNELRSAIFHHGPCRPKGPFAIGNENGNRRIFSENHYHAHYGAVEIERHAMALLLTTDEQANFSKLAVACSAIHRQCNSCEPTVCRAT